MYVYILWNSIQDTIVEIQFKLKYHFNNVSLNVYAIDCM